MTDKCICCGEMLEAGMTACPNCLVTVKKQAIKNKQHEEIDFDYAAEDDNV